MFYVNNVGGKKPRKEFKYKILNIMIINVTISMIIVNLLVSINQVMAISIIIPEFALYSL